jgi:lipopolysaccharide export system permease protein
MQFLLNFCYLLLILLGVIYLLDLLEMMRRAAGYPGVSFGIIAEMSLLKLPLIGMRLLPFAVLFGAMFTFWRLTRTNELVIVRTANLSAWQFLSRLGPHACHRRILNDRHQSRSVLTKFEDLEIYLQRKAISSQSQTGLGCASKQTATPITCHQLIRSLAAKQRHHFYFDQNDALQKRIDAISASCARVLGRTVFIHGEPRRTQGALVTTRRDRESLPIDTLPSTANAEFVPCSRKPDFPQHIKVYYLPLAQPLFFTAMILLAAAVSLRPGVSAGGILIIIGVSLGFYLFHGKRLHAFGVSKMPYRWRHGYRQRLVCYWRAVLFHLEDG